MKLIELPKSPYWGANIHVGYKEDGSKRFSPRSSKVRRDPERKDSTGRRLDKEEAEKVLFQMQSIANQSMESELESIPRKQFEEMVDSLIRATGRTVGEIAPPWNEFSKSFLDRHIQDLSPATARSYVSKRNNFDRFLDQHSGFSASSSLADITLKEVQSFYDWRIKNGSASTTTNKNIDFLQMVFDHAIVCEHVTKNPCMGVKKRDNISRPKEPFTLDDITKITGALQRYGQAIEFADEWARAIRFSIFTGARQSDCVKLKWSDFSDDYRSVRFVPQKKERIHRLKKLDASVSLVLPQFLSDWLKAEHERSESEWLTPSLRPIKAGKTGLGNRFLKILDMAGVEYKVWKSDTGGISQRSHTFHSFRHTLKTELREGGVSQEANHYVTGHDDAAVGARYIHEKSENVFRECSDVYDKMAQAIA